MSTTTQSKATLTQGTVGRTLFKMAAPMIFGTFAMTSFNLADTWFVAELGKENGSILPLAAMGFTFPVIMFIICIGRGLGMGATTVVAQALGQGDHAKAQKLTSHALLLTMLVISCFSIFGLVTLEPLFCLLGADSQTLPFISDYMVIQYSCLVFFIMPMIVNDIIRSTGDTIWPSAVMVIASAINIVLDPIMIFGHFGFPRMEIQGAALATVISNGLACIVGILILHNKHRLVVCDIPRWADLKKSWAAVLHVGLHASFSLLLQPLCSAVITRFVAVYGSTAAVAACAAGSRIEMFAFMVPMCLGLSVIPFTGQNFGAGRMDRVLTAAKQSLAFAFLFGFVVAGTFSYFAPEIADFFLDDAEAKSVMILYLRIITLGYGLQEVHRYCGFFLNGIHRPRESTLVNIIRTLVLLLPLTYLGAVALNGITGIFWARATTDILSGIIGGIWILKRLTALSKKHLSY